MAGELDMLGADEVGFDYGSLISAAGTLAEGGIAMKAQSDAEAKATAEERDRLAKAQAADNATATAIAQASVAAQLKGKQAGSPDWSKVDSAGDGLSDESAKARLDVAAKATMNAAAAAKAAPKDGYKKAYALAWGAVVDRIKSGGDKKPEKKESWWTRRVIGPIPGYGVVVGGTGIAGVLALIIKRFMRR